MRGVILPPPGTPEQGCQGCGSLVGEKHRVPCAADPTQRAHACPRLRILVRGRPPAAPGSPALVVAELDGHPETRSAGRSPTEALGGLVMAHAARLGLDGVVDSLPPRAELQAAARRAGACALLHKDGTVCVAPGEAECGRAHLMDPRLAAPARVQDLPVCPKGGEHERQQRSAGEMIVVDCAKCGALYPDSD